MGEAYLITASQTHALKGKYALKRLGISAEVHKIPKLTKNGCGFAVFVKGDVREAARILKDAGIPVTGIRDGGR